MCQGDWLVWTGHLPGSHWVVIWELVGFAPAKHIKKIVVFGGDLITEGFEFLRIKGF